jgi:hypothetical protein
MQTQSVSTKDLIRARRLAARRRAAVACARCKASKLRCTDNRPCKKCAHSNFECVEVKSSDSFHIDFRNMQDDSNNHNQEISSCSNTGSLSIHSLLCEDQACDHDQTDSTVNGSATRKRCADLTAGTDPQCNGLEERSQMTSNQETLFHPLAATTSFCWPESQEATDLKHTGDGPKTFLLLNESGPYSTQQNLVNFRQIPSISCLDLPSSLPNSPSMLCSNSFPFLPAMRTPPSNLLLPPISVALLCAPRQLAATSTIDLCFLPSFLLSPAAPPPFLLPPTAPQQLLPWP